MNYKIDAFIFTIDRFKLRPNAAHSPNCNFFIVIKTFVTLMPVLNVHVTLRLTSTVGEEMCVVLLADELLGTYVNRFILVRI